MSVEDHAGKWCPIADVLPSATPQVPGCISVAAYDMKKGAPVCHPQDAWLSQAYCFVGVPPQDVVTALLDLEFRATWDEVWEPPAKDTPWQPGLCSKELVRYTEHTSVLYTM